MAQVTPAELSRLLDQQSRALCLYAAGWCDVPEDVVQEALIALAGLPERPCDPVSWLYAVTRNKARMAARGKRRRLAREREGAERSHEWFEPSLDEHLDARTAQEALSDLDAETREVIVAHIWGELTFEQIAIVVDASSSTVHRRYLAGLNALRTRLDPTWTPKLHSTKS